LLQTKLEYSSAKETIREALAREEERREEERQSQFIKLDNVLVEIEKATKTAADLRLKFPAGDVPSIVIIIQRALTAAAHSLKEVMNPGRETTDNVR